ncbi:ABC transporter ATP-binding protein [Actinospongicola halichondriae]|uniref:ABC transporter ATP-binding protein n=1 Tax=Actinospongicola halichondriae TaxID=3236844 RepID=UPI003D5301CC
MAGELAIEIDGLVKDYGSFRALDGVDLEVRRGDVFGFLGPNGAGKSTTIRVLLDLLRPTAGTARVFGQTPLAGGPALRARIGYLPGELVTDGRRTAGELLEYLARLRGRGHDRIQPLADRFGLDLTREIRGLSKGNKQKIGVVQVLMHDPDLLVLDEPTSGLDPLLQHEFLGCVREANEAGATVLLSSHVLSEVEDVAGPVAIIRSGRIVDVDHVDVLRHRAGQDVVLTFATPIDPTEFRSIDGVEEVRVEGSTLTCRLHGEPDALLKLAAAHHVVAWCAADRELEHLFLDHYRLPADPEREVRTSGR